MPRITMTDQPDFAVLPSDSIVLLKIEETSIREVDGKNGKWEKLNVKFKVLDIQAIGDGSPKEGYESLIGDTMWGSVPFKLTTNPENKLRQWVEAIFGMELSQGFELDTDLLEGRTVRGITSQYASKTTDASGKPFMRHQVDSLLPYGSGVGSLAAVTPKPDPWATQAQATGGTPAGSYYTDEPPF
jgi:hypothetical protein